MNAEDVEFGDSDLSWVQSNAAADAAPSSIRGGSNVPISLLDDDSDGSALQAATNSSSSADAAILLAMDEQAQQQQEAQQEQQQQHQQQLLHSDGDDDVQALELDLFPEHNRMAASATPVPPQLNMKDMLKEGLVTPAALHQSTAVADDDDDEGQAEGASTGAKRKRSPAVVGEEAKQQQHQQQHKKKKKKHTSALALLYAGPLGDEDEDNEDEAVDSDAAGDDKDKKKKKKVDLDEDEDDDEDDGDYTGEAASDDDDEDDDEDDEDNQPEVGDSKDSGRTAAEVAKDSSEDTKEETGGESDTNEERIPSEKKGKQRLIVEQDEEPSTASIFKDALDEDDEEDDASFNDSDESMSGDSDDDDDDDSDSDSSSNDGSGSSSSSEDRDWQPQEEHSHDVVEGGEEEEDEEIVRIQEEVLKKQAQTIRERLSNVHRAFQMGIVYDEGMLAHKHPTEKHVERPERITKIYEQMVNCGIVELSKLYKSRQATRDEVARVHTEDYIDLLYRIESMTEEELIQLANTNFNSVYLNASSMKAALLSCGGVLALLEAIMSGQVQNGFAIVRPPGHHAESSYAMGFCLIDNVAVATRVAQSLYGVQRVLILDWDVHHGNGIQHVFQDDPNVLYVSLHRYDNGLFYPNAEDGAGNYTFVGTNGAEGRTVNIPWPCGGMGDGDYLFAFEQLVMPIAREFQPQLVIVAAGFDAAMGDPLGECNITPAGFSHMTHKLSSLADGKLMLVLEGGYNVRSIAASASACAGVLLGYKQ